MPFCKKPTTDLWAKAHFLYTKYLHGAYRTYILYVSLLHTSVVFPLLASDLFLVHMSRLLLVDIYIFFLVLTFFLFLEHTYCTLCFCCSCCFSLLLMHWFLSGSGVHTSFLFMVHTSFLFPLHTFFPFLVDSSFLVQLYTIFLVSGANLRTFCFWSILPVCFWYILPVCSWYVRYFRMVLQ